MPAMTGKTVCEFMVPERRLSWWVLLALAVVSIATPIISFSTGLHGRLRPVVRLSGGLIDATMLVYLIEFAVLWLMLVWWSGLRSRDLGLDWSKLKAGAGVTLAVWVVTQIVHVSIYIAEGLPIQLHADWSQLGVSAVLGLLIGQLFGNALYEEIVFRHLFVSQLSERIPYLRAPTVRLLFVLAGVQFFFAVMHIPHRLAVGVALGDLPEHLVSLTISGLWYAWIYLQTRNLFFAVGMHALANNPTLLTTQAMYPPRLLMWIVTFGLLVHLIVVGLRRWPPARWKG